MTQEVKTTEVVAQPSQENAVQREQSAESLIQQAIDKNVPVETMERLLAMRRELKAEFAKEQFDNAMAAFQGACPVIKKDKPGGKAEGQVAYYYAPLDSIVSQVKNLLKDNGFSYTTQTETGENNVKVTCTAKHTAGHSESSQVQVPLGTKTNVMSASQVVASALTFAKRYAFCNAFGILTGDDDDDSQQTPKLSDIKSQIWSKIRKIAPQTTRETVGQIVLEKTGLQLAEANSVDINDRLNLIISERNPQQ